MQEYPSSFKLYRSQNVVIAVGNHRILFDPNRVPTRWHSSHSITCISHAHSDHVAGFKSPLQKLATSATLDIYRELGGKPRKVNPVGWGDQHKLSDEITLDVSPAGHMLGAAQFILEKDNTRLVYTGDFNLLSSMTTKGADPITCDVLLMEATYGRPDAIFPPREKVHTDIVEWISSQIKIGKIPSFHVYASGKAQDLIRIINRYLTTPVIVNPTISKVNRVYQRHNINLEYFCNTTEEGKEIMRQGDYVHITSKRPKEARSPSGHRQVRAVATGWAQLYPMKKVDKAFVLSSHADFQQLIHYIQEAQPKAVFITSGDTVTFGAVLEKLKVKQIIPHRKKQLRLSDFQ